jgi:hypothetical protein
MRFELDNCGDEYPATPLYGMVACGVKIAQTLVAVAIGE